MFKTSTATLNFMPKDGMKVLVLGTVAVFERDGVYQIYCKAMQEDGIGDLYKKYDTIISVSICGCKPGMEKYYEISCGLRALPNLRRAEKNRYGAG